MSQSLPHNAQLGETTSLATNVPPQGAQDIDDNTRAHCSRIALHRKTLADREFGRIHMHVVHERPEEEWQTVAP